MDASSPLDMSDSLEIYNTMVYILDTFSLPIDMNILFTTF